MDGVVSTRLGSGRYVSQMHDMELGKIRVALDEMLVGEKSLIVAYKGLGAVESQGFGVDLLAGKEELVLQVASTRAESPATRTAVDW